MNTTGGHDSLVYNTAMNSKFVHYNVRIYLIDFIVNKLDGKLPMSTDKDVFEKFKMTMEGEFMYLYYYIIKQCDLSNDPHDWDFSQLSPRR